MSHLIDADTSEIIRDATEAEEDASDRAAAMSNCEYGSRSNPRGVFEIDGRRVYVPVPSMGWQDTPRIAGEG